MATYLPIDPLTRELGDMVYQRRIELGWSQQTLETNSGISHDAISRIESGRGMPYMTTFVKLLAAMGCRVTYEVIPIDPPQDGLWENER